MTPEQISQWFSQQRQRAYVEQLRGRVGLTRRRAECFVRLWAYLCLKQNWANGLQAPIERLEPLSGWVSCTCREAAALFYSDCDRGSDRSAGLMLSKLAALGLIQKSFDGNTLNLAIAPLPDLEADRPQTQVSPLVVLQPDAFDPRCDAVPVANLLAANYNWMNRNADAVPYRIAELLRQWASQYGLGMRVLRRCDNLNPVGFYLLYPTHRSSEMTFFGPSSKGLHLSAVSEVDPFVMAPRGDETCRAVFIRSWMIDSAYQEEALLPFLQDAQQTLRAMIQDFPNLCDLHTMLIHPGYEKLTAALGFQKTSGDSQSTVCWMYLALDRFCSFP
ncbi:MAG: hypothetical protein HC886_16455 [Leptolyngbyaceae cyanobacterium SM1_1_3]|nr:hypothetical protein [Leptolyngbyaceae cyanobacterium SM1_1_3]